METRRVVLIAAALLMVLSAHFAAQRPGDAHSAAPGSARSAAPDDYTFVLTWKQPYYLADAIGLQVNGGALFGR